MDNDSSSFGLPASGRWSGYYAYSVSDAKHRMTLHLTFSRSGTIDGEGIDDVAPFHILGVFDAGSREAQWTKAYVGMHSVEYRGVYDGRNILGTWTLDWISGSFRIWPGELSEDVEEEAEAGVEEPEAVLI